MTPEEIQSHVLYRDHFVIVLDKPAGIPVHAGPKGGETIEDWFDSLKFNLKDRPALAHRLDRETSGCLVLGRHHKALARMGKLFQTGQVQKTYWAVVHGTPPETGTIDAPLRKRSDDPRSWWMEVHADGLPSRTEYRVLKTDGDFSLVELTPKTGRTHQIRVHMAHIGHPLAGEKFYKLPKDDGPLLLHARAIRFQTQVERPPVSVTAPLPDTWPQWCGGIHS